MHIATAITVLCLFAAHARVNSFQLSVVHLNDFHARYDEIRADTAPCRPGEEAHCVGGIARVATVIEHLRTTLPNAIVMNAGDNYQGTMYHNVYKHDIAIDFLNMLNFDVFTLGNHEFDEFIVGLVPFMRGIAAPFVVANMDSSAYPHLAALYRKSLVLNVGGKRIGIVGVINDKTNELSNTENVQFTTDFETVNAEATRLLTEEDVFTVIVLSHCGYERDLDIARYAVPGVSLIVGAHSHTLLYNGTSPSGEDPAGDYPTVATRSVDGGSVLIVQASCYTQYVGGLTVTYSDVGDIVYWEGAPIYLSSDIEKDEHVSALLAPYKDLIDSESWILVGETLTELDRTQCRYGECTLGNMISDGMLFETDAQISLINYGDIRATVGAGDIYIYDLATAQPFGGTVLTGHMSGRGVRACFEHMASPRRRYGGSDASQFNILQMAGVKLTLDLALPIGNRTLEALVRTTDASSGETVYEPLIEDQIYKVVAYKYLASGGDGFQCFPDYFHDIQEGETDLERTINYVAKNSPLSYHIEGRITILNNDNNDIDITSHIAVISTDNRLD